MSKKLFRGALLFLVIPITSSCGIASNVGNPGASLDALDASIASLDASVPDTAHNYSLGEEIISAWSSSFDVDPKTVIRGECTTGSIAIGINHYDDLPHSVAVSMTLTCVQLLQSQLSTTTTASTLIGTFIQPNQSSTCANGLIAVGIAHGSDGSLHTVAPLCAKMDAWFDVSKNASISEGIKIGTEELQSRALCPQGTALIGIEGSVHFNGLLTRTLRAVCAKVQVN